MTLNTLVRAGRVLAAAIAIGIGAAMIWANVTSWGLEDWRTYLAAADRVATGGPVYDWSGSPEFVYRYAPWFAYALVPFLWLPSALADVIWSALAVAGTFLAIAPLLRRATWASIALAVLAAGLLIRVASTGNIHPVLIGALVIALPGRAGPLMIALAASLKAVPIVFVAVYLAERRWWAAAACVLLTLFLVAPMAWLGYEMTPGPSESLFTTSPVAWGALALTGLVVLAVLAARASEFTGLGAGAAAYLLLPRSFVYDVSLVLPAIFELTRDARSSARAHGRADGSEHAQTDGREFEPESDGR